MKPSSPSTAPSVAPGTARLPVLERRAAPPVARSAARGSALARLAESLVRARLDGLAHGALAVTVDGRTRVHGRPRGGEPDAALTVRDPRFWPAVLVGGSVGAGEAWIDGWWTAPDLPAVIRLFAREHAALQGLEGGLALLARPLWKLAHALRANTERGSRRNIAAHYDLSNDFFRLWLDPTMTYSCGIFERPDATLEEAQVAKIDRLCRKLDLQPGERLLEIGTGWGAFALHAAREYGCRVTTTTISRAQGLLARERIAAAGLADRIELRLEDYRRLEGRFDKLVSVEMIEAVGHRFYPDFFASCARLLEPHGLMALQAITIADAHYERARRSVDFIQRHVFPGSCIPSVTALLAAATRASDLRLVHLEDIGPHYERTLAEWRARLLERRAEVHALGLDERFVRLWEFYLAYCEGGFAERHLGDAQMVLARPAARQAPLCGAL